MIPVIIATAVAAAAYKAKPECSVCHSKITWNQPDMFSHQPVCGKCGIDVESVYYEGHLVLPAGRHIKTEKDKYDRRIEIEKRAIDKLLADLEAAKSVKVWPETYQGKVPAPTLNKRIHTDWHRSKSAATDELAYLTAKNRCSHVQKAVYFSESQFEGNYEYTVWLAEGVI